MEMEVEKEKKPDIEIVNAILENKHNFSLLVNMYSYKVTRYIKRITNITDQDREDLLQNIFVKIYININSFNTSLSLNAWIYRIAHNEVVDFSRKQNRIKEKGHIDLDDEFFELFQDSINILDTYSQEEITSNIKKSFSEMTIKYREVLYLKYIEMYSYKDISDILKKPESNIATMIYRAKKEFKKNYQTLS